MSPCSGVGERGSRGCETSERVKECWDLAVVEHLVCLQFTVLFCFQALFPILCICSFKFSYAYSSFAALHTIFSTLLSRAHRCVGDLVLGMNAFTPFACCDCRKTDRVKAVAVNSDQVLLVRVRAGVPVFENWFVYAIVLLISVAIFRCHLLKPLGSGLCWSRRFRVIHFWLLSCTVWCLVAAQNSRGWCRCEWGHTECVREFVCVRVPRNPCYVDCTVHAIVGGAHSRIVCPWSYCRVVLWQAGDILHTINDVDVYRRPANEVAKRLLGRPSTRVKLGLVYAECVWARVCLCLFVCTYVSVRRYKH